MVAGTGTERMRIVPSRPRPRPRPRPCFRPRGWSRALRVVRDGVSPLREIFRERDGDPRGLRNAARVSASSAVDGPRPSDQSFSFPRSHPDESAPWVPTRVPTAPAASSSARIHASRVRQPPPTHANDARLPGGATTSNSHPPSFQRAGARTTTRASARECAAKMTRFRARPPVVRTGARTKGPSEGAEGSDRRERRRERRARAASRLCSSSTLDIAEASARRMSFPGTTAAEQEIQRPAAREVAPEGKRPRRHVSVPERRTRGSRPGRDERGASFGSRRPAERRSRTGAHRAELGRTLQAVVQLHGVVVVVGAGGGVAALGVDVRAGRASAELRTTSVRRWHARSSSSSRYSA